MFCNLLPNRMKHFFFFLLLFSFSNLFCQKEGNVWPFAFKAGLIFNNPGNIIDTSNVMETLEGSAAISDAEGNLLFYTNGGGRDPLVTLPSDGAIYNRNHEVMYDMNGVEGGGWSSSQSSIIVPNPDATYLSVPLSTPCLRRKIHAYANKGVLKGFIGLTNFTDHFFRNDALNQPLSVGITPDALQLCDNQTATLTAVATLGETFLWNTGVTTPAISINAPGTYTVTVSSGCCATGTASVVVQGPGSLDITITGDTVLCPGVNSVELTASAPGAIGFLWNTGVMTPNVLADAVGIYTVTAIGACDDTATGSITVRTPEPIALETYQSNTLACEGFDTLRVITNAMGILWSTSDTTTTIIVDTLGSYTVTVTNGCDSTTATLEVVLPVETKRLITNVFTPNGDGSDDVFLPLYDCPAVSDYEFRIHNRWGKEVFSTTVPTAGWDGKVDSKPGPSDVYMYVIRYRSIDNVEVNRHGAVTLVR